MPTQGTKHLSVLQSYGTKHIPLEGQQVDENEQPLNVTWPDPLAKFFFSGNKLGGLDLRWVTLGIAGRALTISGQPSGSGFAVTPAKIRGKAASYS